MNLKICVHGVVGKTKYKTCNNAENAVRRANNLERYRGYGRKWHRKKYGVHTGEKRMGDCPLCDRKNVELRPDHNHETGIFRDWICAVCNQALGFMSDRVEVIKRFLAYVEKHL